MSSLWSISPNIHITILDFDVYVSPDEVFEPFVGIDTDLRMNINEYIELYQRLNI